MPLFLVVGTCKTTPKYDHDLSNRHIFRKYLLPYKELTELLHMGMSLIAELWSSILEYNQVIWVIINNCVLWTLFSGPTNCTRPVNGCFRHVDSAKKQKKAFDSCSTAGSPSSTRRLQSPPSRSTLKIRAEPGKSTPCDPEWCRNSCKQYPMILNQRQCSRQESPIV